MNGIGNGEYFDVIIIGGGVVGAMTLRALSAYKLRLLMLEKASDIADGATMANSAIVHAGFDPLPGTKKAYFNVRGAGLYPSLARELDFIYSRLPSLVVSYSEEQDASVEALYARGKENGVRELEIIGRERLLELEPNISLEARCALYAPGAGIVEPWGAAISAVENAMDNGAKLHLAEKVVSIEKLSDGYSVLTDKGEYKTRTVVNAAGLGSAKISALVCEPYFDITGKRGQYYLLDRRVKELVRNTLFACPTEKGKGVLITPSVHEKLMIGPDSVPVGDSDETKTDAEGLAYIRESAAKYLSVPLPVNMVIRTFAGIRPVPSTGDFIVGEEKSAPGFFNAAGIESPGLASAPAIGAWLAEKISDYLGAKKNPSFNPLRRKQLRLNRMNDSEKDELISRDRLYASIVCKCEKVSEAEIIDVIHRNAGATTVKGVKKRAGAGLGRCQAGFCQPVVVNILARELGIDKDRVCYDGEGSELLTGRTK